MIYVFHVESCCSSAKWQSPKLIGAQGMKPHYSDTFGFWKRRAPFAFDKYLITPLEHYDDELSVMEAHCHNYGYLPPMVTVDYRSGGLTTSYSFPYGEPIPEEMHIEVCTGQYALGKKVDNSTTTETVYRWNPSHIIEFQSDTTQEVFRHGEGAFVINFLAFFYQTVFQFGEFFFWGKIPFTQKSIAFASDTDLKEIMETVLATFRSWDDQAQKRIINTLAIYQRGQSQTWQSDKYTQYYIAMDTLWKLGSDLQNELWTTEKSKFPKGVRHKERIIVMCRTLGIQSDVEPAVSAIDQIYTLRNNLFHEANFGMKLMNLGISNENSDTAWALDNLVERLIIGILGLKPSYLGDEWVNSRFQYSWK